MPPVFDSHTHLGMTLRRLGLAPVADNVPGLMMRDRSAIRDALENGAAGQAGTVCGGYELRGCINVNCWAEEADPRAYKSYEAGLELQRRVPNVFGTYGLHPHNADRWSRSPARHVPFTQGCMRRGGTSEAAPEAVRQAVGGGCQNGWGRLLSVTNAAEAGIWRQGDSVWAYAGRPGGGGGTSPPSNASLPRPQVSLPLRPASPILPRRA